MNTVIENEKSEVKKFTKADLQNASRQLMAASRYDESIRLKEQELEYLMNIAQGLCSPTYALGTRINTGFASKEGTICTIVNIRRQIEAEIKSLADEYAKIKKAISSVSDSELRLLLELRYLTFKTWEEIAEEMNYSPRHIVRVHERALLAICGTDFFRNNFE